MFPELSNTPYILLATFRKSGQTVETPVWFAQLDDTLYVFSSGNAGKVKRLRNHCKVKIASCTMTGKQLGQWHETLANILTREEERQTAYRALRKKYGWQMALLDFFATLGRKKQQRAFIAIREKT